MVSADHHEVVAEWVAEQLIDGAVFETQLDLCAAEIRFITRPEDLALGEPEALHFAAAYSHDGDGPGREIPVHADASI